MPANDEAAPPDPKAAAPDKRKPKAPEPQVTPPDLFALTIDAANGRIVKLERLDATGAHQALSAEDKARLARIKAGATVRRLVEQAFEAGIECVLGEDGEAHPTESKADDELSAMLLQSLVERSRARQLTDSEVLNRAIVGTLIAQAATAAGTTPH
jgi:hypothetical protein